MSELEEEEATQGGVRVANEVIASIAAMAACEVDGVAEMDEANARHRQNCTHDAPRQREQE